MKSWIDISSTALAHNLRAISAAAGEDVAVLAVVKADGYGHGASVVSPTLVRAGAQWLGVTDLAEGITLRAQLGPNGPRLMVMCGMDAGDAEGVVANGLTQVVWTPEHVNELERAAATVGRNAVVHLEIDTGMGRQGAAAGEELARTLAALQAAKFVQCEGLMTHLCESEVMGSAVTARQLENFSQAIEQVTAAGVLPKYLHVANSSAVDEGSTMAWVKHAAAKLMAKPMVRPGLAMYGHCLPLANESSVGKFCSHLQPVLTWKTQVIGVREVVAGTTVGYGATYAAPRAMQLALLPVGYADGFRRAASSGVGNGWVMIGGQRAAVVGRVSMNLIVVDISSHVQVSVGEEATLLGEGVSAEDHAQWAQTISYDILCGIRARFQLI